MKRHRSSATRLHLRPVAAAVLMLLSAVDVDPASAGPMAHLTYATGGMLYMGLIRHPESRNYAGKGVVGAALADAYPSTRK
jgi:hypothetical protein